VVAGSTDTPPADQWHHILLKMYQANLASGAQSMENMEWPPSPMILRTGRPELA